MSLSTAQVKNRLYADAHGRSLPSLDDNSIRRVPRFSYKVCQFELQCAESASLRFFNGQPPETTDIMADHSELRPRPPLTRWSER